MRLINYKYRGEGRAGAVVGDWVVDLERAHAAMRGGKGDAAMRQSQHVVPACVTRLLLGGAASLRGAADTVAYALDGLSGNADEWVRSGAAIQLAEVSFLPPVLRPKKIICMGLNYKDHALEAGLALPVTPELFAKFSNSLIGHREAIELPRVSEEVDYEAELGVVIGAQATAVGVDEALDYVAGYTVVNDVSVRDYQARTSQWLPGKSMDRTTPIGPWIVTADEIADPQALEISLDIDGVELQRSNTLEMAFSVAEAIEFISSVMTLDPGDVISTGTPHGVGLVRDPPRWLRDGETVSVHIEGIGTLSNPVAAPAHIGTADQATHANGDGR